MTPGEADQLVERVREMKPEMAEEVKKWRCPHDAIVGFSYVELPDDVLPGSCGARVLSITHEVSATMIEGTDAQATRLLARGIDPGPPRTRKVPSAYDVTFTCMRGHEVYIRTEDVKRG